MSERHSEIWSTRVQREILALKSSCDESKKLELLPPFISVVGHEFDLEGGTASVEFRIEVELGETVSAVEGAVASSGRAEIEGDASKKIEDQKEADEERRRQVVASECTESKEEDAVDANAKEGNVFSSTENQISLAASSPGNATLPFVILVLDASLYIKPGEASEKPTPMCYPFQKPRAIIKSGTTLFSGGSSVQDGDELDIDLDWTPSIHLSDAVTHVALKIRECVKRKEPLFPFERKVETDEELLSESIAREARESIMETKKAMGAMFSSFASRGSIIAAKGQSLRNTLGETLSARSSETGGSAKQSSGVAGGKHAERGGGGKLTRCDLPKVGDEIDLSEEPWNLCIGMYSCKAIKRPEFVERTRAEAAREKQKDQEVASSGFAGAGSMFSRFAQSAKSAMEESFLLITEQYITEFKSNRLNIGSGTVTFAISIDHLAKLKFRREESLSLFFKEAAEDPLVYMCLDSALAVQDIQNVLKRHGVKGKHTNAATQRAMQTALNMVALIQRKEKELLDNPSVDNVNEIMDLYRQAAEKFESAGDPRHAEVVAHMRRFLNQKFTTRILDGSFMKEQETSDRNNSLSQKDNKLAASVPQGEILEHTPYLDDYDSDDDDDIKVVNVSTVDTSTPDVMSLDKTDAALEESMEESIEETMQNVDNILEEAKRDMEDFGMGEDDIDNILTTSSPEGAEDDDPFAELDAMLSNADKELNDLMNS